MYQLAITRNFIAQHYLIGGDWGKENEKHSHHYKVEVHIEAEQLDPHGYLIDIVALDNAMNQVMEKFQEKTLNDLAPFAGINPSLERFAQVIWEAIQNYLKLEHGILTVKLWENDNDWAGYRLAV